jgi:hypothetical protein
MHGQRSAAQVQPTASLKCVQFLEQPDMNVKGIAEASPSRRDPLEQ